MVAGTLTPAPLNGTSDVRRLLGEPYGGRRILERLAHLFGWEGWPSRTAPGLSA